MEQIQPEIVKILEDAKSRLEQWNASLRPEALGRCKNDEVILSIKSVLPKRETSINARSYNSDLVYPSK